MTELQLIEQMKKLQAGMTPDLALRLSDPTILNPDAVSLTMPPLPPNPFETPAPAGNPFSPVPEASPFARALKAAPGPTTGVLRGLGNKMLSAAKTPAGLASIGVNLALTDWDSSEGIGEGIGGTIGGLAGTAIPIPVVGPIIGSTAGRFLGKTLGGLFGDDEEEAEKEAKERQSLAQLMHNMRQASEYLQQSNLSRIR